MNRRRLLKLIGKDCPQPVLVTEDQGAGDIMKRMALKHRKCAPDYDQIANEFSDGSIYQICNRLFEFCKSNIYYSEESIDVQSISSPQTILTKGHCDCKGYALFVGGVLDALKRSGYPINWVYRFASYKMFDETPGHVFVVVDPGTANEIWIDPVLKKFDDHKEYCYHIDRKIKSDMMKVNGVGCCGNEKMGSTSSTGAAIMKLAPALSEVPVAALAVEVVGLALNVFGSKYDISSGVRKLIERYECLVLGQNVHSFNSVNQSDQQAAQGWFSLVLGVPIYDSYRLYALKGVDPNSLAPLNVSYQQRALNYFASAPDAVGKVTTAQVIEAAHIADTMNVFGACGSWAQMTAAPASIAADNETPGLSVNAAGQLVSNVPSGNMNIILLAAAAIAAYLILK